jgi:hypothetical protein
MVQWTRWWPGRIPGSVADLLDWSYGRAVAGIAGDGAAELAAEALARHGDPRAAADALIRAQAAKAGAVGFATGIGGAVTLPIAVPADLAGVLYMQIRLIAAIAVLGGHDLQDERVKLLVLACLLGAQGVEAAKAYGTRLGSSLARGAIDRLSAAAVDRAQRGIAARLAGRIGAGGLSRLLPLVGGLVGGALDVAATRAIGAAAKQSFLNGSGGPTAAAPATQPTVPPVAATPLLPAPQGRLGNT